MCWMLEPYRLRSVKDTHYEGNKRTAFIAKG